MVSFREGANICMSFIGLLTGYRDTVNSVWIVPRTLPFTKTNNRIHYFRHALSLDERRCEDWVHFFNSYYI